MNDESDDFLAHHGVPGMKWGVRHDYVKTGYGPGASTSTGQPRPRSFSEVKSLGRNVVPTLTSRSNKTPSEMVKIGKAAASKKLTSSGAKTSQEKDSLSKVPLSTLKHRAEKQTDRLYAAAGGKNPKYLPKDSQAKPAKSKGLSKNQKIALGVSIGVAAVLAGAAAYKYTDLGPKITEQRKALVNKLLDTKRDLKLKSFNLHYDARLQKKTILDMDTYKKLSDESVKIPAGTVFKRLTVDGNEPLTKNLYTTYKESDNDRYAAMFGSVLKSRTDAKEVFVSEMKMGKDILSPSPKQRIKLLADLLEENKPIDIDGAKIPPRALLENLNKSLKDPKKSNLQVAVDNYDSFTIRHFYGSPLSQAYFAKLKESGFNALIDDNDAGALSEAPMILLDAANTVASRTSTPLTSELEGAAIDRLKNL